MNQRERAIEVLKLIGKHAEVLVDLYLAPSTTEEDIAERPLSELLAHGICIREGEDANLQLTANVHGLIKEALRDHRYTTVAGDTGAEMRALRGMLESYSQAIKSGSLDAQHEHLALINQSIAGMRARIQSNARALWGRITNSLASITDIELKAALSKEALTQAEGVLENLQAISSERISEMQSGRPALREQFYLLERSINRASTDLGDAIARLKARIFELEGMARDARFVRGLVRYLKTTPAFEGPDMPFPGEMACALVPAAGMELVATFSPADVAYDQDLIAIAIDVNSRIKKTLADTKDRSGAEQLSEDAPDEDTDADRLKRFTQAVDLVLEKVEASNGAWISAVRVYDERNIEYRFDVWAFAVLEECLEKGSWVEYVDHELIIEPDPVLTGMFHIQDIMVRRRMGA